MPESVKTNINISTEKRIFIEITGIIIVFIVSLFLLSSGTNVVCADGYDEELYLTFVNEDNQTQRVKLFKNGEGYHAFLPSYASLESVSLQTDENVFVLIDGQMIGSGEETDLTQFDNLKLLVKGENEVEYPLFIHASSNIPSLWIRTKSGSIDNIHESKENKEPVDVVLKTSDGLTDLEASAKIKCHGYTTFYYTDKKSYQLKFDDTT